MKTSEQTETLAKVVKEAFSGDSGAFRPCAFFDDRLDCIRVIARDCSVLEERLNDRVTVLIDMYAGPGRKKYVGFTIKGARHFCQVHGWNPGTSIRMTALLDAVVASSPEMLVDMFINFVARPLVQEGNIEQVDIPDGELAAV